MAARLIAFAPLAPAKDTVGVTAGLLGAAIVLLVCTVFAETRGVIIATASAAVL